MTRVNDHEGTKQSPDVPRRGPSPGVSHVDGSFIRATFEALVVEARYVRTTERSGVSFLNYSHGVVVGVPGQQGIKVVSVT